MTLTAVVVDDEAPARKRLVDLLAGIDDVRVAAVCVDGPDAVAAVRAHRPDVLFLDVQMPEMDGLAVLAELGPGAVPAVVFVTAYDRHAVAAFDARALDYLLKPFTEARFRETLARVRTALATDPARLLARIRAWVDEGARTGDVGAAPREGAPATSHRLPLPTERGVRLVDPADVGWIEADGNYVVVHAAGERYRTRATLTGMVARLAAHGMIRVHHSHAVNVHHVRELQPWTHGEYAVLLRDGSTVVSSRSYSEALRRLADEGRVGPGSSD